MPDHKGFKLQYQVNFQKQELTRIVEYFLQVGSLDVGAVEVVGVGTGSGCGEVIARPTFTAICATMEASPRHMDTLKPAYR